MDPRGASLRMTVSLGVLKTFRFGGPKTRKVKKVTTSQDDGLVGVLKYIPVRFAKNRKYGV
jgi:hypothetical protein